MGEWYEFDTFGANDAEKESQPTEPGEPAYGLDILTNEGEPPSLDGPAVKRLKREIKAEAMTRFEESAKTEEDFLAVIEMWDRLDDSRERRERRNEIPFGDVPLDYGRSGESMIFPRWYMNPGERQLASGDILDYLFDCPYEMHNLPNRSYLQQIIKGMKEEHKELLYFLYLRYLTPQRVATLRSQTDRNIRKVRDVAIRKVRKKVYMELQRLVKKGYRPSLQEREFCSEYQRTEGNHEESV